AAQFTADLTVTSPESEIVYDLKVKDNMYRLEKVKGPLFIPSLPTIYNRTTGISWGLIPQMNQYVEQTDPVKTMMMNPLVGWEFMRRNLEVTPTGTETIQGYLCQILEYRQHGDTRVANRVWVSPELDFTLKEVSYALNGDATLALKNIKKGPVDPALFEIPPGYSKVVIETAPGGENTKSNAKKSDKAKKLLSKTLDVKRISAYGISLKPDRHIIITATGNSPGGSVSSAYIKVLDKGNNEILVEKITLQNGETRTWEVPPDREPWTLYLSGEKGLIKFKVDQLADEPANALQTPQTTIEKPIAASVDEESATLGNLMFILDASGSMWGQVEGTAKIVIAKEVLTDLIQGLPDDTVVGLVAYGHRRKGDCDDVEELIALGPLNKQAMIAQVQDLNPKGKTPISRSVRLTAERIKHLEDETTIILVSDGKETCDPDPCGLVKDLKASGIKFIMHVIGFDVTEEEKQELECMAREGGGKYFTAGNASQFSAAASEVVKKPTLTYGTLRITVSKNGKPFFTAVTLTNLETGKSWAPISSSGETGIAEVRLDPGNYTAELKDLNVSGGKTPAVKLTDIVIVVGEIVERSADFSDGTLVITTLLNGAPFNGRIYYYRQDENKHFHNENAQLQTGQLKRQLLPGVYRIEVKTDSIVGKPTVVIDALEIPPGSTVEKTAEFFSGEVTVASTLNGEPYNTPFKVYDSAGKEMYKAWTEGHTKGQRLIRLPAGIYTIKVTTNVDGSTKSFENVIVETGQSQVVEAAFNFGKLTIVATLNRQPFSTPFKVYNSAGKQVCRNWTQNGQRTEMLAEGIYTIKVISIKDGKQVVTFDNVNIINRQSQIVTADFPVACEAAVQPVPLTTLPPAQKQTSDPAPSAQARPEAAPAPKTSAAAPFTGSDEQRMGGDTIMNGEIPLMEGTKVLKNMTYGPNAKVEMEVPAPPEEVVNFYKQAMTVKGWEPGIAMVQGNMGVLQLKSARGQLVIKAQGQGQTSKVSM
ncbi:MAG: VWA domain-containing protein, partial [Desulfobulbaceae bacterium]|nr:VWA domain-containing protein [Desulfobulbaceae bacterium]